MEILIYFIVFFTMEIIMIIWKICITIRENNISWKTEFLFRKNVLVKSNSLARNLEFVLDDLSMPFAWVVWRVTNLWAQLSFYWNVQNWNFLTEKPTSQKLFFKQVRKSSRLKRLTYSFSLSWISATRARKSDTQLNVSEWVC